MAEYIDELKSQDVGVVHLNEPLAHHSSWRIGGPAQVLVEPNTPEQIRNILVFTSSRHIPLVVIGNGTNLLFNDEGICGIVMKLGNAFSQYCIDNETITAEAGISAPKLAKFAGNAGLTGLEHVVGIPGSLGGLVVMNGGSQGCSIGRNVRTVWAYDRKGNEVTLSHKMCNFSYRHSSLQGSELIVYRVELILERGSVPQIQSKMRKILDMRKNKFPVDLPNCGSVFLNKYNCNSSVISPGKLIEDAGLKGFQVKNAKISDIHANFIVNLGGAKGRDVVALVQHIRKTVYDMKGVWLQCEVKYVTRDGNIIALHEIGGMQ